MRGNSSLVITLNIQPAQEKDKDEISKILEILDLYHPTKIPEKFWVAKSDGKVVGVACLNEYDDFFFLSSVGVVSDYQRQDIARTMLKKILGNLNKDVYLYTIIPDFFKKFGFKIVKPPRNLPSKESLECENCLSDNCVCMVKLREERNLAEALA